MHTQMGDHTLSPVRLTAGLGLMPLARPLSSKPTSSSYQLYLKCVCAPRISNRQPSQGTLQRLATKYSYTPLVNPELREICPLKEVESRLAQNFGMTSSQGIATITLARSRRGKWPSGRLHSVLLAFLRRVNESALNSDDVKLLSRQWYKQGFFQISSAFSDSTEEREMGESQGNELYEKFLKKHRDTMEDLHLRAATECSQSIMYQRHLELVDMSCPRLFRLSVSKRHVGNIDP
ncbi:hypothetical protein EDD85DRAFT_795001 [Armillaria nabsnona]|nr:hypothetical protein EDD85DRAFT_795001 [Armillaria nabsnona]